VYVVFTFRQKKREHNSYDAVKDSVWGVPPMNAYVPAERTRAKAFAALSEITVRIRGARIDCAAPVSLVIGGLLTWAGIALVAWPLAYLVYLW
jgi:hypothetical protein